MAWIESHEELPTHRKTRRVARTLDINVPQVIGHLHCLWYWCLTHAPDGNLGECDAFDVADAAMWDGDPEAFVKALLQAGWLDDDGESWSVHDWWDGAGKTIARRRNATQRQRRARSERDESDDGRDSQSAHGYVTRDTREHERESHASHDPDSDRDRNITPVGDEAPQPPRGPSEPYSRRLARELEQSYGWKIPPDISQQPRHDRYKTLLVAALELLPEEDHHSTAMGLLACYWQQVAADHDQHLPSDARKHLGRLVKNHGPTAVLDALGEALVWGAGLGAEHAGDSRAVTKYVTKVLGNRKAVA